MGKLAAGEHAAHVAAVIVNWNRWDDTRACVERLLAGSVAPRQIVVVDNGSAEGGPAALGACLAQVTLLALPRNLGFAGGANAGIRRALADGADYVLTLNNDALADRGCLAALLAAAERGPADIVGPKICYRDPPDRIWFAGADRDAWTLALFGYGKGRPDGPAFDRPRDVSYLCAGAMLTRRTVFAAVGLFDAGYFMYYEDCDFCLRALAGGFRLRYAPAARVWHTVAASTGGEGSPAERYYRACSVFRFIGQHSHGPHRAALLGLRATYLLAQIGWLAGRGRAAHARALLRGLRAAWPGARGASCGSF